MSRLAIAGRPIGPGAPCFVIAEAGVNHNGEAELARRLVDVAAGAGADAVKFQTFKAERLVTTSAPKAEYQVRETGATQSQLDMLRRLELSDEAHRDLVRRCATRGLVFLSTPFDEACADFLDSLGVAAFKIPSGEITNLPFLAHIARKGKPMIVSTGMATLGEVEAAVRAVEGAGNTQVVLLHCVSDYPAAAADVNLRAMTTMQSAFGCPVGYSDHTLGIDVALAAVALGACILEKHFTVDRTLPGPDHRASLEPDALSRLVDGVRTVVSALGHGRKLPTAGEEGTATVARKSLVAARPLAAGTVLTERVIAIKRPGTGLPPGMLSNVVGRTLRRDVDADTVLTLEMLT